jgi:diaminopimelate decarboxylase
LKQYAGVVKDCFQNESYQLLAEPGRWIVGHAGVLLTQVVAIKKTSTKTFVILQSGMNHLMRPSLYQAQHRILPLIQKGSASLVDVVGPICESSDVLLKNTSMTAVEEGDWVAIADAGAYGFVMANNYNLHALPIEYLI